MTKKLKYAIILLRGTKRMLKNLPEFIKSYKGIGVEKLFEGIKLRDPNATDYDPIFNLTDEDTENTYSLKKLYLSYYKDPTEVSFVDGVLQGRFDLWKKMCKNLTISKFIEIWREEARTRYLADNFKNIMLLAEGGDKKTSLAAYKYLSDKVLSVDKEGSQRGRPSKREIEQNALKILSEDEDIKEAFERVQGSAYC